MKKMMIVLLMILMPVCVFADNSECILRNTNSKSSFVPGEIITFEYGLNGMPSGYFGNAINYVIGYDSAYFEIVSQSGEYSSNTNGWNSSSSMYEVDNLLDDYKYVLVKANAKDDGMFLLPGYATDVNIIGNIKLKVKSKVVSDVTEVLLDNEESKFYQYSSTTTGTDDEGEDTIVIDKSKNLETNCYNEEYVKVKIVNKNDDAFINKIKLIFNDDAEYIKEITEINENNTQIEVNGDVKTYKLEATCSGKNCKITGTGEFSINETEHYLTVESDNSIRYYYVSIYSNEQDVYIDDMSGISTPEEISNLIISNDDNVEEVGPVVYIVLIASIIIVGIIILIFIRKNKKKLIDADTNSQNEVESNNERGQ